MPLLVTAVVWLNCMCASSSWARFTFLDQQKANYFCLTDVLFCSFNIFWMYLNVLWNFKRISLQSHLPSCRRPTRSWTPSSHPGLLVFGPSAGRLFPGRTGSDTRSSSAWARLGRNLWVHKNRRSSRRWGRATAPGRFPERSYCLKREEQDRKECINTTVKRKQE